jgi:hypothetical protein
MMFGVLEHNVFHCRSLHLNIRDPPKTKREKGAQTTGRVLGGMVQCGLNIVSRDMVSLL